ncbi:MAG: TolC family protein [Candidatus Schekmanbacteria bacterium]|nr:TolC family protein [Candidatus Schekmanbacteria bacterium]
MVRDTAMTIPQFDRLPSSWAPLAVGLALLAALGGATRLCSAAEEPQEADAWEIEQLMRLALASSAELRVARAEVAEQEATVTRARWRRFPDIELKAGYRVARDDEQLWVTPAGTEGDTAGRLGRAWGMPERGAVAEMSLQAPIFDWGATSARVDAAKAELRARHEHTRMTEREVVAEAFSAFMVGLQDAERETWLLAQKQRLSNLYQLARNLHEGATQIISDADLLLLEGLIATGELDLEEAMQGRLAAQSRLDEMIGTNGLVIDLSRRRLPRPDDAEIARAMSLAEPGETAAQTPATPVAELSPRVREWLRRREAIELAASSQRRERLPRVGLTAQARYWSPDSLGSAAFAGSDYPLGEPNPQWSIRVDVSVVPRAVLESRAANAETNWKREAAEGRIEQESRTVVMRLAATRRSLAGLAASVQRLSRLQIIMQKRYDLVERDFAIGLAALTQVVRAEESWKDAHFRYLETVRRYQEARFLWEQLRKT